MKICFFGSYEKRANNMLLKKILEKQGIEIIECQEDVNNVLSGITSYVKLFLKHRKLEYDIMITPWRSIMTLPLAKLVAKGPIVNFPMISIYDTLVLDRKKFKKSSAVAKFLHWIDKMGCKLSDIVILDSNIQVEHFVSEFKLDRKKARVLFISADEEKFPRLELKSSGDKFVILFFGSFIPSHGIDFIIEAARILNDKEDIVFRFCGDGHTKKDMERLAEKYQLRNIKFLGFVTERELRQNIKDSDICVGPFSREGKSQTGTYNKIFQILASQRVLVMTDMKIMEELHAKNNENCVLIQKDNPMELVETILLLKNDSNKLNEIAKKGHKTYEEFLSMEKVGKQAMKHLDELMYKNKKIK